jgi:hypothetical protein
LPGRRKREEKEFGKLTRRRPIGRDYAAAKDGEGGLNSPRRHQPSLKQKISGDVYWDPVRVYMLSTGATIYSRYPTAVIYS